MSLTPLIQKWYKSSPFVLYRWCVPRCTQTGANVPDAAKPQHFRLEVEARFRDASRSAQLSVAVCPPAVSAGVHPSCWAVNDL